MSSPIEKLLDAVDWHENPPLADVNDGMPYATHSGVLRIGDVELECHVLNTGQRVFTGKIIEDMITDLTKM